VISIIPLYEVTTLKVKVKYILVQALKLCTCHTAQRRSSGIALLFHDHGTRRGWGVNVMPRLLFTPGKDPVPIVQEAGWAPGSVWTGVKNLAPTGIWTIACSQLLYRLRYQARGYNSSWHIFAQSNIRMWYNDWTSVLIGWGIIAKNKQSVLIIFSFTLIWLMYVA
jgi:hypothetical protein